MRLHEVLAKKVVHYDISVDKASASEIKTEITYELKDAGVGSTVHYKTKKGVTIGTVTDKGIVIK